MTLTWNDVVLNIINTAFRIVVTIAIPWGFSLLRAKLKNDTQIRYLNKLEEIIRDAVAQVQQTYVDNLKADGVFDVEAQTNAFNMAKDAVMKMVSDRMKEVVTEVVGDFEEYLNNKIEAEVHYEKQGFSQLIAEDA